MTDVIEHATSQPADTSNPGISPPVEPQPPPDINRERQMGQPASPQDSSIGATLPTAGDLSARTFKLPSPGVGPVPSHKDVTPLCGAVELPTTLSSSRTSAVPPIAGVTTKNLLPPPCSRTVPSRRDVAITPTLPPPGVSQLPLGLSVNTPAKLPPKGVSELPSASDVTSPPSLPPTGVSRVPPTLGVTSNTVPSTASTEGNRASHTYKDRLERYVHQAAHRFRRARSYTDFIRESRGKGDLHPSVGSLPHPAGSLLQRFQKEGVPATMKLPNWDSGRKRMARERGPHKSAHQGIDFLREEFADMMEKEHWTVLPLALVENMEGLRLSPLGLVPQRDRRDRMICDYSFFGVNDDTEPQAAKEAMQFGRALQRVLHKIHHASDHFGPVYMSKIDLSDGFYRLWVKAEDTISLAVLLPMREGEEQLVGIPLTNPMGWVESPPNFCTCTETVADLANQSLRDPAAWKAARKEAHRLDEVAETPPGEAPAHCPREDTEVLPAKQVLRPARQPIAYWDIYVDDFLGLAQGNKWRRRAVKRVLLRALDRVFRPLEEGDNAFRKEPASIKKMKKGDATWATHKTILGWDVDSISKTIALPIHRVERLREILSSVRDGQKTIPIKDWHKIMGELRSMALALPGAAGLFSVLQEAFRHQEKGRPRVRLNKTVHGFLDDFRNLATNVASRPTRIAELIPDSYPATVGACDACGEGMGGVHFVPSTTGGLIPILWRERFPNWVQKRLVSFDNPDGDITNSDLELAGSVAQNDVLARYADVTERTTLNLYDNTATVYWQKKGSTTTLGPAAYLLRIQALHQRHYRYVPTREYIPGPTLGATEASETHVFESDVRLVKEAVRAGVSAPYRARKDKHLEMWHEFCLQENIAPDLRSETLRRDPMEYLQVFAARYRDGRIAPRGKPVKSRTVEDALRSVGQSFTLLGAKDPTKDDTGKTDYRLRSQLRSYEKEDAPPNRVKPVPITVVESAMKMADSSPSAERKAIANMLCIAFYFCLRPGEYTGTTTDDQAFSLDDVSFFVRTRRLVNHQATDTDILSATAVHLRFTTQKNQERGTVIAHARSENDWCCPVVSLARQFITHREHCRREGLPYDGTVKLASYYLGRRCVPIEAKQVTRLLRYHTACLEPVTGISPKDVSARSLRAGGAMALLTAGCDSSLIKLLARWKSDAMMRYLHQQSLPIFKRLAIRMYNHGTHAFLEGDWVPATGNTENEEDEEDPTVDPYPEIPPEHQGRGAQAPPNTERATPPVRTSRRRRNQQPSPIMTPKNLQFNVNYYNNARKRWS